MYDLNLKMIEQLIGLQKSSLKLYIYYAFALIGLGLVLVVCSQLLFSGNSTIKTVISAGGAIITSFCGLSFKEFLNKKENINLYNTFKDNIEMYKDNTNKQEQFETALQNFLFKK